MLTKLIIGAISIQSIALSQECASWPVIVMGSSLSPLVVAGERIQLHAPECLTLATGQLVAFRAAAHQKAAVIKRIVGMAGQELSLEPRGAGLFRVMIDGEPALAVDGKPYEVTRKAASVLDLYVGKLPKGTVLVLGKPGTLDSSKIGPVPVEDIIGVMVSHNDIRAK